MANVHLAASLASLMALENHALDIPWYTDLVTGMEPDYMSGDGYVVVPEAPGLGVELDEDAVRAHLVEGTGYFDDTGEWDRERTGFLNHLVW